MLDAQKLKIKRESMGFSQEYVAKHIGVGQPAYSDYERGYKIPSLVNTARLAELFVCTVDELLRK